MLLAIRLLGPFDVKLDGSSLPRLRYRKGQWLLALLVLWHGRELDRSWLAEMLWPDSPRSQAMYNLRRVLTELRHALGAEGSRLCSSAPHTLSLDLAGAEVDVTTFDQSIEAGDIPSFSRAVSLYRGPLLQGCAEEWIDQPRESRQQGYLAALEALAAHFTVRGDLNAATNCLRQAVTVDPLRESAQRRLIEILAAGGDVAAANQAYRAFRHLLLSELNAEPTFAFPIAEAGRAMESRRRGDPSSTSAKTHGTRTLPNPLTDLVGRAREVREVQACLATSRLVTLTGTGGVGKTRLAIQVARAAMPFYRDGAWFVDLAPLSDPSLLVPTVAKTLQVQEARDLDVAQAVLNFLERKSSLLILDNCEHLLDACVDLIEVLLRSCPTLKILLTSRQAFHLTGETVYHVPSLSCPPLERSRDADTDSDAAMLEYEAVRLFVERSGAISPTFALTKLNASAVAEICRQLGGIPLAIELAAARLNVLTVGQVAGHLDDCFALLTEGSRSALPRHRTLRAAMDWSYDLLTEEERRALRRMSVFAGGWTLNAAGAVCSDREGGRCSALDLLSALAEKSLVEVEADAGEEARYRLLETVRQFAGDRLFKSDEQSETRARHRDFYLALAEEAEGKLRGPEQMIFFDRLVKEQENLRAALQWCLEEANGQEPGLRLAGALGGFWWIRGDLTEGRNWLERVLIRSEKAPRARAKALAAAGQLAWSQGDFETAHSRLEESTALGRRLNDPLLIVESLHSLGWLAHYEDRHFEARKIREEALAISEEMEDRWSVAYALHNLGRSMLEIGDPSAARSLHERSLGLFNDLGDRWTLSWPLIGLGHVARRTGECDSARLFFEECLEIRRAIGFKGGVINCLNNLGSMAIEQKDYAAARLRFEECLQLRRDQGNKIAIAQLLSKLAFIASAEAEWERAIQFYRESSVLRWEIKDMRGASECMRGLYMATQRQVMG